MKNCCLMSMCTEKLAPFVNYAPLVLRVVLGIIFMGHGLDKLFGCFGGGGIEATTKMFGEMGLQPAALHANMAGWGEFLGGLFVFLGFLTPIGCFLISATMVVAIGLVHLKGGLFARDGGFEYPLLCLASAITILLASPTQKCAVDNLIKKAKDNATS